MKVCFQYCLVVPTGGFDELYSIGTSTLYRAEAVGSWHKATLIQGMYLANC